MVDLGFGRQGTTALGRGTLMPSGGGFWVLAGTL